MKLTLVTVLVLLFKMQLVNSISFASDPPDVVTYQAQTATLQCQVRNKGSFSVYWWSVDQNRYLSRDTTFFQEAVDVRFTIVGNHLLGFYNLRISNVNTEDAGGFRCAIIPTPGEPVVFKQVNLVVRQFQGPDPHSPICATHPPTGADVKVGQVVTISCSSEGGVPLAQLTWLQNGHSVIGPTSSSLLTYAFPVEARHNGLEFTCTSSHPTFTKQRSCTVVPFRQPPDSMIEPPLFRGFVGSTVTFTCLAHGSPPEFEYAWFFANHPVNLDNPRFQIIAEGSILMIHNVLLEYNGVSVRCDVSNVNGISSANALLVIVNTVTTEKDFTITSTTLLEEDFENEAIPDLQTVQFGGSGVLHKSNPVIIAVVVVAILVGQVVFISAVYVAHKFTNRMKKAKHSPSMSYMEDGVKKQYDDTVLYSVSSVGNSIASLPGKQVHLYKSLHRYDTANNVLGITRTVNETDKNDTYSFGTSSFSDDIYQEVPQSYEVPRPQHDEEYVVMRPSVTS